MTRVLTVNAGSTSVRLALFEVDERGQRALLHTRAKAESGTEPRALQSFLASCPLPPDLSIHRVVHGGRFLETCPFDAPVRAAVQTAAPLAPLHNPATLAWLAAWDRALPGAPALAAFDTGFFRDLPEVATTYGLPRELSRRNGIRRFGFHGLAHRSMWETYRPRAPTIVDRVISLQLGGGCSAAALRGGRPVETSMGFSPLEGLLMASRPGDLDPGALLHLMERERLDPAATRELLHRRAGLLGISGASGDLRQLLASTDPAAALAVEVFCHRVRKYVGAYLAVLGGCDAILIGGGAGEGSATLRRRLFTGLEALGIEIDDRANETAQAPAPIGTSGARVALWVVPTDEESVLADEARAWLAANPSSKGGSP